MAARRSDVGRSPRGRSRLPLAALRCGDGGQPSRAEAQHPDELPDLEGVVLLPSEDTGSAPGRKECSGFGLLQGHVQKLTISICLVNVRRQLPNFSSQTPSLSHCGDD